MLLDVDSGAHRGRGAVGRAKRPLKQRGVVRPVGILLVLLWFHLVTAHNYLLPMPDERAEGVWHTRSSLSIARPIQPLLIKRALQLPNRCLGADELGVVGPQDAREHP